MRKEEITNIVRELLTEIPSNYEPLRVYVYGSTARGDSVPGSDLDLLVELKRAVTREIKNTIRDKAWELSLTHEILISTVVVSAKDFEEGPLAASAFAHNVKKEGIEIAA